MRRNFLAAAAALAVSASILAACGGEDITRYGKTVYSFGTEANITLYGDFNAEEAQSAASAFGSEAESYLINLESELEDATQAFNDAEAGESVEIGETAYSLLSLALEMYAETGGYYNAGVYTLVDLFGFSSRFDSYTYTAEYAEAYDRTVTGGGVTYATADELPDKAYITAFTELCSAFGDIKLNGDGVSVTKPQKTVNVNGVEYSLEIDLGGIAKGYAADVIGQDMSSAGYAYGNFSFGSSSMYVARSYTSEDGNWTLTIRNPRSTGEYYLSVKIADSAVTTSGDYERYYFNGGVRFSHIINPYTGLPANVDGSGEAYAQTAGIISATIIGGKAAENDARTTAVIAMGLDKAIEYINSEKIRAENLQFFIVYSTADGGLQLITNVAEGGYTLTDTENFTLASAVTDGKVTYTG